MKTYRLLTSLVAILLAFASVFCFSACGKAPVTDILTESAESSSTPDPSQPSDPKIVGNLVGISKYGNVYLSTTTQEMTSGDFAFGDVVSVSFAGQSIDIPYCSNYSDVDAGNSGLFGKPEEPSLILAVNLGNFATAFGIADKVTSEDQSFEWVFRNGMSDSLTF